MNIQQPIRVFSEVSGSQKRRYGIYKCEECGVELKIVTYDAKKRKNIRCRKCIAKSNYKNVKDKFTNIKYHKIDGKSMYTNRIYKIFNKMKSRCLNKDNDKYEYYGGRGISIHKEWTDDFMSFYNWSVNNGYSEKLTIDRIDNDGNYEPNNCRWTPRAIQQRNQRVIRKNNTSGYKGVAKHQKGYIVQITVNNKNIYLGFVDNKKDGAILYNNYVIENDLEHTLNIIES